MFYDLFKSLCDKKGVSVSKACIEMGLSRSIAAKWKNTRTNPSAEVLPKIAQYFNVSTDYLLGNEPSNFSSESQKPVDRDIRRIERARQNMTERDKKKMMDILKASFDEYFSDDYEDDDDDE